MQKKIQVTYIFYEKKLIFERFFDFTLEKLLIEEQSASQIPEIKDICGEQISVGNIA